MAFYIILEDKNGAFRQSASRMFNSKKKTCFSSSRIPQIRWEADRREPGWSSQKEEDPESGVTLKLGS